MTQVCPGCGTRLPKFSKPTTLQQFLIGGWTCSNCKYEVDWLGKEVKKTQPNDPSVSAKYQNLRRSRAPQTESNKETPQSGGILFIRDVNSNEQSVIIGKEEVPLDNRFGSSILESEHEFSQKATRTIRLNSSNDVSGQFKAKILTVLEAEVCAGLAQSLGIDLQQEEFRRVTLRLKADSGKSVLYRIIWRQTQRSGEAEVKVRDQMIRVPYVALYGLSYSVESILQ
ncbi:MAG: hypothetical protein KME21_26795 [Desmonostoc vinosum HA7617-LM4]|nr:hypothetical protein [Desmonostoc vinosum HA7617-LM4]